MPIFKDMIRLPSAGIIVFCLTFGFLGCKGASVAVPAPVPPVREPVFEITSIAVMQAELINTRFKVTVRIGNPNPFPVSLSSFNFELYGSGRLWAEGTEKDSITVAADSFAEKELFLKMNFIDMRRDLLDRVITMQNIQYRFTGTVQITTALDSLPAYTGSFNLEGESEVIR
jgi:LEA14-like dessication related protein